MKHLFVPYELALLAKENKFNEECLGHYHPSKEFYFGLNNTPNKNSNAKYGNVAAPLYQQLINWFRSKHSIYFIEEPLREKNPAYWVSNIPIKTEGPYLLDYALKIAFNQIKK